MSDNFMSKYNMRVRHCQAMIEFSDRYSTNTPRSFRIVSFCLLNVSEYVRQLIVCFGYQIDSRH